MIPPNNAEKRYRPTERRTLRGALDTFFAREFTRSLGPLMRGKLIDELLGLIAAVNPPSTHLKPGQCLWLAVDRRTRADSPSCRLVPVVLSLFTDEDGKRLADGTSMTQIAGGAIARIMREAESQGALLSMRDIELLSWRSSGSLTKHRQNYEREHECVLPHTGSLHDMGSCITHKTMIVTKAITQGIDPCQVARQTNHSLRAVERYVNDYQRVEQCYRLNTSPEYIAHVTGIALFVVHQYIEMLKPGDTP